MEESQLLGDLQPIIRFFNKCIEHLGIETEKLNGSERMTDYSIYLDLLAQEKETTITRSTIYKEGQDQLLIDKNLGTLLNFISQKTEIGTNELAQLEQDLKPDSGEYMHAQFALFSLFLQALGASSIGSDISAILQKLSTQDQRYVLKLAGLDNSEIAANIMGHADGADSKIQTLTYSTLPGHLKSDGMLKDFFKEFEQLQSTNEQLSLNLEQQKKEMMQLRSENQELREKGDQLAQEINRLRGSGSLVVEKEEEYRQHIEKLEQERTSYERIIQSLQQDVLRQAQAHLQEEENLKTQNNVLLSKIQRLENDQENLLKYRQLYSDQQRSTSALNTEKEELKSLLAEREQEAQSLRKKAELLSARIKEKSEQYSQLQIDIHKRQIECQALEQEVRIRKNRIDELEQKLAEEKNRYEQLVLESHRSNPGSSSSRYQNLGDDLEVVLQEKDDQIQLLEKKIEQLQQDLAQFESTEELRFRLQERESLIELLKKQNLELVTRNQTFEVEGIESLKKDAEELRRMLEQSRDENLRLQRKLVEKHTRLEQLEKDTQKSNQVFDEAQQKILRLQLEKQDLDSRLSKQNYRLLELESGREQSEQIIAGLKEQILKLKAVQQSDSENKRLQELIRLQDDQMEQLSKLKQEKHDFEKTKRALQLTINELESDRAVLKQERALKEEEIKELLQNLEQKQQQVQALKTQLNDALILSVSQPQNEQDPSFHWRSKLDQIQRQNNEEIRLLISVITELKTKADHIKMRSTMQ